PSGNRGSLICPTCPGNYFAKCEIVYLPFFRNKWFDPPVPLPPGGAFGQSPQTLERDAMDAEVSPGVRSFRGRAKPRGPDSPTLESSLPMMIDRRRRLSSPALRGERGISRKPSRRERRTVRRTCGDLLACFLHLHARLRVRRTPGAPCALLL